MKGVLMICLVGFILLLACIVLFIFRRRKEGLSTKEYAFDVAWALVPAALLVFLAIWSFMGLCEENKWLYVVTLVLGASGVLMLFRGTLSRMVERHFEKSKKTSRVFHAVSEVLLIIIAVAMAFLALELPWNDGIASMAKRFFVLEVLLILLVTLAAYFLCSRRGVGSAIVVALFVVIGIAEYFVIDFKNTSIMPSDLFAISTAAEVSGAFKFVLGEGALKGLACGCAGLLACSYINPNNIAHRCTTGRRQFASAIIGVILSLVVGLLAVVPNYEDFGATMLYFDSTVSYKRQGFLPSFIKAAQDLPIKKPYGYSQDLAKKYEKELASAYDGDKATASRRAQSTEQFGEKKPVIVAVMCETFSDCSIFDGLQIGYTGPSNFKSVSNATSMGQLSVSVLGGGTCNTEFEFLTGNSLGYIGAGKYPYSMYDLSNIDALPKQLSSEGFKTVAIHPAVKGNWNRGSVYSEMGFDKFLSIDDFDKDVEKFHFGVSDKATYDKVLEQIAETPEDQPLFVWDLTIANHAGYFQNNIAKSDWVDVHLPKYDCEQNNHEMGEYLSCIQKSDKDLKYLMDELQKLDRPVVLVFFGDHQPYMTPVYNNAYMSDKAGELAHDQRVYQTCYLTWANYDIAGTGQTSAKVDAGPDTLAAMLLDQIGAPLTNYQKAQLEFRKSIVQMNQFGYKAVDGNWYEFEDTSSPYYELVLKFSMIEYARFGANR